MPTVIPVKFRYATRDLWFDPRETDAIEGDHLICETERGQEIGLATADPREVSYGEYKRTCGDVPLRPVLRLATEEDLDRAAELAEQGDAAMPTFRRLAEAEGLDMKPVGVEYLFDGDKVVCYFSADERVDFRQLVRNLSRELHRRIDMRQIGVREEAALVGGFGHCGQELCCARFGRQFDPVSIRMAKEQDLPLNSTKISGACGRLMCCLRYEFEAYRDFKQRAPKRNAVIDTPLGKAKIVEYDTPKEELALRLENGKVVRVKLAEMETSEAAVKKSEELKCPCRPDTVTREALEKLNSPDVQMALAELDREAGLIPEETFAFDESDIFVSSKPRRRSRGGQGGSGGSSAQGGGSGEGTGRKRRRRKGGSAGEGTQAKAEAAPQQGKRRARHAASEASAEQAATPSTGTRRRRRHHSEGDAAGSGSSSAANVGSGNSSNAGAGKSSAESQPRRRRPGDRGGTQQQGSKQGQQPSQVQPKQAPGQQANQPGAQQPIDGAAPKKRRRRRRRGGGNGGDNKGNAAVPSNE